LLLLLLLLSMLLLLLLLSRGRHPVALVVGHGWLSRHMCQSQVLAEGGSVLVFFLVFPESPGSRLARLAHQSRDGEVGGRTVGVSGARGWELQSKVEKG
jgi:hypothetical protein